MEQKWTGPLMFMSASLTTSAIWYAIRASDIDPTVIPTGLLIFGLPMCGPLLPVVDPYYYEWILRDGEIGGWIKLIGTTAILLSAIVAYSFNKKRIFKVIAVCAAISWYAIGFVIMGIAI